MTFSPLLSATHPMYPWYPTHTDSIYNFIYLFIYTPTSQALMRFAFIKSRIVFFIDELDIKSFLRYPGHTSCFRLSNVHAHTRSTHMLITMHGSFQKRSRILKSKSYNPQKRGGIIAGEQ